MSSEFQAVYLVEENDFSNPLKRSYRTCAVGACPSPNGASYYNFPKDPKVEKSWLLACQRQGSVPAKYGRICHHHFAPECFERDLKNELLGLKPRRLLKPGSVPTLRLDRNQRSPQCLEEDESPRAKRVKKREAKEIVNKLLSDSIIQEEARKATVQIDHELKEKKSVGISCKIFHEGQEAQLLKDEIQSLREKLRTANLEVNSLKKQVKYLKSSGHRRQDMKKVLEKTQTPAEVKRLLSPGQKHCRYSQEDMIKALVLKSMSNRTYEYLRKSRMIALPSRLTVDRWLKNSHTTPGIQHDCLKIMKETCLTFENEEDSLAVLSFDEIDLKNRHEFDSGTETIYGDCHKAQAAMIRGLFKDWKQPIYFKFKQTMDKRCLFEIITEIEKIGVKVLSIAFNLGNRTLISQLGLFKNGEFAFINPADPTRKVYAFPDAPHLIKLARNHLLDKGFLIPDGNGGFVRLGKEDFEHIVSKNPNKSPTACKLTNEHLECKGSARHKLLLACQIFSRTTAKCFTSVSGEADPKAAIKKDTILLFNDWFDVMNSSFSLDSESLLKSAFGVDIQAQTQVLDDMAVLIEEMKLAGGRTKTKLPWQLGMLTSINSMKEMYQYLTAKTNVRHILTSRLNQDCLDNFFSQLLRMSDDNTRLGPDEALGRVQILLLGKNYDFMIKNPYVRLEGNNEETYVSSTVFKDYKEPRQGGAMSCCSKSPVSSSAIVATPAGRKRTATTTTTSTSPTRTTTTRATLSTSGATQLTAGLTAPTTGATTGMTTPISGPATGMTAPTTRAMASRTGTTATASASSTTRATSEEDSIVHSIIEDEADLFPWIESLAFL